jgi:hypothetical protein
VVLKVADELAHPRAAGPLSALFPEEVQQEAARRYRRIQASLSHCRWGGMAWVASVLASLVLLVSLSLGKGWNAEGGRGIRLWLPVVIVLGPLGLVMWLIVGRARRAGTWRSVLLEVIGDVIPTVVAFAIFLALALSSPAVLGSELAQVALIFGLPLAAGWLVFQGPLLALATKRGYLRTLGERLPQALVAANLGLAGVNAVAAPLVNVSTRACSLFPSPGWAMGIVWASVVLGAVLGGALLFIYESWAARRGFQAWRVLASSEDRVSSPSWRSVWWWIPLSFAAILGGLVASAILQQLTSS